ncbi:MAG TPA: hypothetical protein VMT61_13945 [Candidatus Binataceae bacterium]|nr:hypothetical protein [Candidatus Binataceae bacterium]
MGFFLIALGGLVINAPSAFANKVDCGKVMSEVGTGKKTGEIAKDLNISTSSVYRCQKKAGGAKSAKASPSGSPAAAASPASH